MMRPILTALMLVSLLAPLRAEEEHGFWWYARAKVACLPDVLRLCKGAMPDEDKVRDCMKSKKATVSTDCAEFYPGGKNSD